MILSMALAAAQTHGQQLGQVSFLNSRNLSFFSILTQQDFLIRVSEDGKILEWGTEVRSDRGNFYAPRLQPFMGRVEYYDQFSDSAFRGKVKSIGTSFISYYGGYEEAGKRGKLKSIGTLNFDYYSTYDEKGMQGKLKLIGELLLEYYGSYEDAALRGKLKAVGSLPIGYYSVFNDKFNAGKLKSIGSVNYLWYPEYDRAKGALRSNNYRQLIGGIWFILR